MAFHRLGCAGYRFILTNSQMSISGVSNPAPGEHFSEEFLKASLQKQRYAAVQREGDQRLIFF